MAAIGEKLGPGMPVFLARCCEGGYGPRLAAGRWYGIQTAAVFTAEQNHTITAPGSCRPTNDSCVAQNLNRAAAKITSFEFPAREEGYRAALGRPERRNRAFTARDWLRRE